MTVQLYSARQYYYYWRKVLAIIRITLHMAKSELRCGPTSYQWLKTDTKKKDAEYVRIS